MLNSQQPIAGFTGCMCNGRHRDLVTLDQVMDDVAEPWDNRRTEIEVRRRKLALAVAKRILLDYRQHGVDGLAKLAAKSSLLRIVSQRRLRDFFNRRSEQADAHDRGPSASRCWMIARASS